MRLSEGRPSATAQRVAMRRAAHQLLDSQKYSTILSLSPLSVKKLRHNLQPTIRRPAV